MSSEQLTRKENKTRDQGEAAHFESLTGSQPAAAVVHHVVDTVHVVPGVIQDQSRTQKYETQKNQSGPTLASSKNNYGANQKEKGYVAEKVPERTQYTKESRHAGKDIVQETGKTVGEFAGKAAGVAKDAALVAGRGAAELSSEAAAGVTESMENLNYGVSGVIEGTASAVEAAAGTVVGAGRKGASYLGEKAVSGKDVAIGTGRTAGQTARDFGGKAAGVAKDAALVAGRGAVELASETQEGLRESMGGLNAGVGGVIENAAVGAEIVAEKAIGATGTLMGTVVGAGKKGAGYIGETGKTTAGVVKDATLAAGRGATELASDTAVGVVESIEGFNAGVGGIIESAAVGAEIVGGKVLGVADTMVDLGKKGAGYIGGKAVAGKDISLQTSRNAGGLVGRVADAAKDATLAAGLGAAEFASDTVAGASESIEALNEGVAGLVEGTALATENVAQKTFTTVVDVGKTGIDVGKKGVGVGKDITVKTGKTAAEYAGKAANVAKDATLAAGWSAAELAAGTAAGVTESMENLNYGVAGLVEGTATATENVVQKTFDTAVEAGKKGIVGGKDIAFASGKATSGFIGKGAGVVKDATLAAGWGAAELASDTIEGVTESMDTLNDQVAVAIEGASQATEDVAQKIYGTVADVAVTGKDIALETGKATAGVVLKTAGKATDAALAAGRGAADVAIDTTKATAGAAAKVAGAASATGLAAARGAADVAIDTTKATAGATGNLAGAVLGGSRRGPAEAGRDTTGYVVDSGARTSVVGANDGQDIVVEREKVTVEFKDKARETKKGYKEQSGY